MDESAVAWANCRAPWLVFLWLLLDESLKSGGWFGIAKWPTRLCRRAGWCPGCCRCALFCSLLLEITDTSGSSGGAKPERFRPYSFSSSCRFSGAVSSMKDGRAAISSLALLLLRLRSFSFFLGTTPSMSMSFETFASKSESNSTLILEYFYSRSFNWLNSLIERMLSSICSA